MMWGCRSCSSVDAPLLLFLIVSLATAAQAAKSPWLTLTGNTPAVVARGGFSGLFPDSSEIAYESTNSVSLPDTISWCDVQLTKDGVGICLPTMLLDNCTDIEFSFPGKGKHYYVNGLLKSGRFSVDYDFSDLANVRLIRQILSRSERFDGFYQILTVEAVVAQAKPPALWLNVQNDIFYRQHNLSMRSYLLSISRKVVVNYVSSPEVDFLRSIVARFSRGKTKLVFRFLDEDMIEPSLNQSYGSLLKNLTFIKTFASGILIPKYYIWPVTSDFYLRPHTSVVMDAHKEGLEVFASNFKNDDPFISYNYSYDPLAEYLNFIDNGNFSVDGFLTDFPITAAEAIGCFANVTKSKSEHGKPVVISHYGASGDYPDCTDLAYHQAVEDGADFIDCPVQVTQDGTLICMSSIDLLDDTTAATSSLRSRSIVIPEIQSTPGIFTFNFTWEEIRKNVKPQISSPESDYTLVRNPLYKNKGNFMQLSDFLAYAKDQDLLGILISIEHAAFVAENVGYNLVDAVINALKDSGYNNHTIQDVMIQSTNSSVLTDFKKKTNYKLVYMVDESIRSADPSALADMKKFANAVAVNKQSIYPLSLGFTRNQTDLVKNLNASGFSVFVYVFKNEFVSSAWDFFGDPTVEINSFVQGVELDGITGIITDFPRTSARYRRNSCLKLGDNIPGYMSPVKIGDLSSLIDPSVQPPALAPLPVLDGSDVLEPPLPPVSTKPPPSNSVPPPPSNSVPPPAAQPAAVGRRCTAMSMIFGTLVPLIISGSFLLRI